MDDLLDLRAAEAVALAKEAGWREQGLTVNFTWGMTTPKPAAWLVLESPERIGQFTFWVSGEGELEVGSSEEDIYRRHEDGVTAANIGVLMDDLASRVMGNSG